MRRLDKCSRTCTWLIVSAQRTNAYQRSLLESPLQLDNLKPSSESLSLSQRCTCSQLSPHITCKKLTDSLRFQRWTLLLLAWVITVEKFHKNCKISWGGLKRLSWEESQLVQESHIRSSKPSWKTGSIMKGPLRLVSLLWSRETSCSIMKAEKSSKERDEARNSSDYKFALFNTS